MKATKTKRKAAKLAMAMAPQKAWCLVRKGEFVTFRNTVGRQSPYTYRTRRMAKSSFAFMGGDVIARVLISYRVEAQ
jgi:hypothetical protein